VTWALELGEAAALQSFGAVAVEVVNAESPLDTLFAEQVVRRFRGYCGRPPDRSSMPYMSAHADDNVCVANY